MGAAFTENINRARSLYKEAGALGLDYGCVEVALIALGSPGVHLVDLIGGNPTDVSILEDVVERSGFVANWGVDLKEGVTGEDLQQVLEEDLDLLQSQPRPGRNLSLAGYLGIEEYPEIEDFGHKIDNHVIAILPRDHLPRDERILLKKHGAYSIMDSSNGGYIYATAENLAKYIGQVIELGGQYSIVQLWY